MNPTRQQRLQALALRRQALTQQAAQQRLRLGAHWQALEGPARWLDLSWRVWTAVRARPWLVVLPAAALALVNGRGWGRALAVMPWVWRGLQAWMALAPTDPQHSHHGPRGPWR